MMLILCCGHFLFLQPEGSLDILSVYCQIADSVVSLVLNPVV